MSNMRWFCMILLVGVLLSGCGGSGGAQESEKQPVEKQPVEKQTEAPKPQEPVKIILWDIFAADTDQYLKETFADPVKKKYPYIDMQIIKNGKDTSLDKLLAEGTIPDILTYQVRTMTELNQYKMFYDMSDLIKKHNFDQKRVNPATLEVIKASNEKKQLVALPYKGGGMALFYNKSIFDKFGVPYPKDGMTWDNVVDLAKKLSRTSDGIDYVGFDQDILTLSSSLTSDIFDPKTGKANLYTPEWKQSYELLNQLISIPGNRLPNFAQFQTPAFKDKKNLAMMLAQNIILQLETAKDLDWDMVTFPTYPGKPIMGYGSNVGLVITSPSKNKDAPFNVIETVLSDETQMNLSKSCGYPGVMTPEVVKNYCANDSFLKSKNVQALFKFMPNWPKSPTIYDSAAQKIVFEHTKDLYDGKDINTVIRETEEAIDKKVADLKTQ